MDLNDVPSKDVLAVLAIGRSTEGHYELGVDPTKWRGGDFGFGIKSFISYIPNDFVTIAGYALQPGEVTQVALVSINSTKENSNR